MRLLLDTHIFVWAVQDDLRLSKKARSLINDRASPKIVSVVSLWEIALKRARHSTNLPLTTIQAKSFLTEADVPLLALSEAHVSAYDGLARLHPDPFDRMLIAQALSERLRLITHDKMVARYSDTFILI